MTLDTVYNNNLNILGLLLNIYRPQYYNNSFNDYYIFCQKNPLFNEIKNHSIEYTEYIKSNINSKLDNNLKEYFNSSKVKKAHNYYIYKYLMHDEFKIKFIEDDITNDKINYKILKSLINDFNNQLYKKMDCELFSKKVINEIKSKNNLSKSYNNSVNYIKKYSKNGIIPNDKNIYHAISIFEFDFYAGMAFYDKNNFIDLNFMGCYNGFNIHEYLHKYINPFILDYANPKTLKNKYYSYYKNDLKNSIIQSSYSSFNVYLFEALVRTVDLCIRYLYAFGYKLKDAYKQIQSNEQIQTYIGQFSVIKKEFIPLFIEYEDENNKQNLREFLINNFK